MGWGESWRGCWTIRETQQTNIGFLFSISIFFTFQLCMEEEGYFLDIIMGIIVDSVNGDGWDWEYCYIWGCAVPWL